MLQPPIRLPHRPPAGIPEERRSRILSESRPPLTEIEILAPPQLPRVKPVNAGVRPDSVRVRHARQPLTPAAGQVHVDDGWEGARRAAVDVAGDGWVGVAVRAPESCVVAAVAGGDRVATEVEEFRGYFAGQVHVE